VNDICKIKEEEQQKKEAVPTHLLAIPAQKQLWPIPQLAVWSVRLSYNTGIK